MAASASFLDRLTLRARMQVDSSISRAPGEAPAEFFEKIWALLPVLRDVNRVGAGPGGCFLKGQALPVSWALRHWIRPPGILREVEALGWLRQQGVPVPRVLGFGTLRRCGVLRRSLLLLEQMRDAQDLAQRLERRENPASRRQLLQAVGRALARMHSLSFYHRNLSARNLLVRDAASGPEIFIIDCPRAEWGRFGPRTAFLRRADRLNVARSVLRCGVGDREVRGLLEAMGADEVERIVGFARDSIRSKRSRPLRLRAWLILGI